MCVSRERLAVTQLSTGTPYSCSPTSSSWQPVKQGFNSSPDHRQKKKKPSFVPSQLIAFLGFGLCKVRPDVSSSEQVCEEGRWESLLPSSHMWISDPTAGFLCKTRTRFSHFSEGERNNLKVTLKLSLEAQVELSKKEKVTFFSLGRNSRIPAGQCGEVSWGLGGSSGRSPGSRGSRILGGPLLVVWPGLHSAEPP